MSINYDFENGSVIALGNFDGMHMGHRAVINSAIKMAESINAVPCILMFTEHSLKILKGKAPTVLYTGEVKQSVLKELNVEICNIDFNEIKDMTASEFVENIIIKRFNAKGVCCGFNYHFGKNASGEVNKLKELCEEFNIKLSVSPPMEYIGEPVSSTRIRRALKTGEIEKANEMLGRVFSFNSKVVNGDKRGSSVLNFPTINQNLDENLTIPKYGVYATQSIIDGKCYPSVTNIGIRPTVGTNKLVSETYIINFSGNLYGRQVEVGLLKFIRGEIKYKSFDELKKQILKDSKSAKIIFEMMKTGHNNTK